MSSKLFNGSFPASARAKRNFIIGIVQILLVVVAGAWISLGPLDLHVDKTLRIAFTHIESLARQDRRLKGSAWVVRCGRNILGGLLGA